MSAWGGLCNQLGIAVIRNIQLPLLGQLFISPRWALFSCLSLRLFLVPSNRRFRLHIAGKAAASQSGLWLGFGRNGSILYFFFISLAQLPIVLTFSFIEFLDEVIHATNANLSSVVFVEHLEH